MRLSAIGDVTHAVPTLRILQKNWPQTRITWIIGRIEHSLVGDIEGVEFIVYDKSRGWRALLDLRRALSGRRFDLLLNMQVSPRAALAGLVVKAPLKFGFDRQRGKFLHNLLTNRRIPHVPRQHVLDGFLEFPKALGLKTDEVRWEIPLPGSAATRASELMPDGTRYLAINPCSSVRARNYRNWNIESYAKIIDHAAEKFSLQTVLTGGPAANEVDYAAAICAAAEATPLNLVGKTSLKELLAVLSRAAVVISPDTGPAHMANAAGTPVIGLYATSNPQRSGPYLNRQLTVDRYPDAVREEFGTDVEGIRWGKRVRNPAAMDLIQPQEVIEKLAQALAISGQGVR